MSKINFRWNFSELFPNTFRYLKKFIKIKYPNINVQIPDIKIVFLEKSLFGSAAAMYSPLFNKIYIFFLTSIRGNNISKKVEMKLRENPRLICKYFDNVTPLKTILIHEYQHYLQVKFGKIFRRNVFLPKQLYGSKKENLLRIITESVKKSLPAWVFFTGWKGFVIPYLINKIFSKTVSIFDPKSGQMLTKKMIYLFEPCEIEARIAEIVYFIIIGKSAKEAEIYSKYALVIEKLESNIQILSDGIKENEKLLSLVDQTTGNNKIRAKLKHLLNNRIKYMRKLKWEYERHLNYTPTIIKVAEELAEKIKNELW